MVLYLDIFIKLLIHNLKRNFTESGNVIPKVGWLLLRENEKRNSLDEIFLLFRLQWEIGMNHSCFLLKFVGYFAGVNGVLDFICQDNRSSSDLLKVKFVVLVLAWLFSHLCKLEKIVKYYLIVNLEGAKKYFSSGLVTMK